jgi:hypothetical protein
MMLPLCATTEHDTLYIDMLKDNIDDIALRVNNSEESDDEVKKRLDGACTRLMPAVFNRPFQR